ncbi:uncharacterized protein ARMOST_21882 [Armillaria ostoyae]|uniref:Uncharacterized protein n=1 Tax=Armillaria ostoyae TaxID=47428 RepID=A0A284SBE3_ARMOS|nr:uncharacterized protein ARMOST_21882 [Armillaria ostoyae]
MSTPNLLPSSSIPGMFADTEEAMVMDSDCLDDSWMRRPLIPITIPEHLTFNPEEEHARLHRQYLLMLEQAFSGTDSNTGIEESDETDAFLADEFRALDLESPTDEEDIANFFNGITKDKDYAPYPNKTTALLDILDNLPRLRLSTSQMQMILWLLKETGATDVPSYKVFRQLQADLRELCGSSPKAYTSGLGNHFYVNDIRDSVARDFSNPEIARHLQFYPEETDGPISEVWQAARWKEFSPAQLTPMYARGLRQFYIEELAQLKDGSYVIPHNWIIRDKILHADCTDASFSPEGWTVSSTTRSVAASEFELNFEDIVARLGDSDIVWKDKTTIPEMPNPLRKLAQGDDLYVVMIPVWADDVSGNKSKQYNKHINLYMVNSCLPGHLLQQEYFIRFVSTSPHATSPEQFSALRDQVRETETNPVRCFNAHTKRPCRFILRVPSLPADNPQQSEEASHIGGNGNMGCRKCHTGGPHEHTESDFGYDALHYEGVFRTAQEIRDELQKQLRQAMYGVEKTVSDMQTATGVKDKVAQHWIEQLLAKAKDLKQADPSRSIESVAEELQKWFDDQPGDKINPLLDIAGLDPSQDTPVEILHTILLGIIKYIWHMVHTSMSDTDRDLFAIRLQATNIDGLTVPPIRAAYMMQYRNNLIGKHFKTLMQTMAFHVHDIVTPAQFRLIKAAGALGALLWVPEIENMAQYLKDLDTLIGNVLDAFGDVDPSKILIKIKLHLLPHLLSDIRRFGPAIRNSTEVFECYNAIFRLCSIYSNHQAPSRDIALKFCGMDRLRHMISGGYYWSDGDKKWVQAGKSVLDILHSKPIIQRHLGWVAPTKLTPGLIRMKSKKKAIPVEWSMTKASEYSTRLNVPLSSLWRHGTTVTAQSGDRCAIGSWVIFKDDAMSDLYYVGRVYELLIHEQGASSDATQLVTLESFNLGDSLHPDFDCPVLQRVDSLGGKDFTVIESKLIQFIISVQHDCRLMHCRASLLQPQVQERQIMEKTNHTISHSDDEHFIINMFALHNATLLRKALPRSLTTPRPLYEDRRAHHAEIASLLRTTQAVKRAQTQEKRKATLASNRAKKQAAEEARKEKAPEHDGEYEGEMISDEEEAEESHDEQIPPPRKHRRGGRGTGRS